MTTLQEDVVTLTVATTALLSAVNVRKVVLDAAVVDAQAAAALALGYANNEVARAEAQAVIAATKAAQSAASASQGAGSAAQALAIYGTTNAMNAALATAASQSQLAQTAASSASSVLQQDLSAVSAALHRSPNPVTAMCLYDTSKDSDGGAWIERMQHTSWANEPLAGAWLPGGFATELAARGDNLLSFSEDLDNSAWIKGSSTVVANSAVSPDNTITSDLLVCSSGTNAYRAVQVGLGLAYSFSLFVKKNTSSLVGAEFNGAFTGGFVFNFDTRVFTGISGTYAELSNGWFRLTFPVFITTSTSLNIYLYGNGSYGAALGSTNFWGTKLNQAGVLPSTYSASPELVSNGGFDNGMTGWATSTFGSAGSVANSQLTVTGTTTGNIQGQYTTYTCVIGKTYRLGVDLISASTPNRYLVVSGGASTVGVSLSNLAFVIGSNSLVFVATSTTHSVHACVYSPGDVIVVDNISVKEVTALATPYVPYSTQTNSYYQSSADGKYYKLGATYGALTEVFRGNKAKFPRLAMGVAEDGNVNIYDLTQPGRPMWMRFLNSNGGAIYLNSVSAISAVNGLLLIGGQSSGFLSQVSFVSDYFFFRNANGVVYNPRNIVNRNAANLLVGGSIAPLPNAVINAVAMTVLPDAPFDVATGIQVPTIAVATSGGVSVIKHDGTVKNLNISANNNVDIAFNNTRLYVSGVPGTNCGIFSTNDINDVAVSATNYFAAYGMSQFDMTAHNEYPKFKYSVATKTLVSLPGTGGISLLREHQAIGAKSLAARITDKFNTGYKIGDIRRAYLCNTEVESVGTELVTNGAFDTDVSGWVSNPSYPSTALWSNGKITVSGTGSYNAQVQLVPTVAGKLYKIIGEVVGANAYITVGGSSNNTGYTTQSTLAFIATGAFTAIVLNVSSTNSATFDNISIKEVIQDRSYKAAGASIVGTLTKTPVAAAAQLVAFSGFGATNYIFEPYSADLDFGVGEFSVSAWVNVPNAWQPTTAVAYLNTPGANLAPGLGTFDSATGYGFGESWNIGGGKAFRAAASSYSNFQIDNIFTVGRIYLVAFDVEAISGELVFAGHAILNDNYSITTTGRKTILVRAQQTAGYLQITSASGTVTIDNLSIKEVGTFPILARSANSGPSITLAINSSSNITATAFDGTTTRTVTTPSTYNNGIFTKATANYTAAGKLSINVNGVEVAAVTGVPLASLNTGTPRHNLILNSHTFQPMGGGPIVGTYTAVIAFDGTNTASRVTTKSSRSFIEYTTGVIANVPVVFSFYIRRVSGSTSITVNLNHYSSDTTVGSITFTATTSWQRISVSGTPSNSGVRIELIGFSIDDIYWGAQLEQGTVTTAYQQVGSTYSDYDTAAAIKASLTIGNSRTLDAPFPGSITLLKIGATVPTPEQEAWMYEQEKQMFRPGALVTLPDATAVLDLSYDESQDKWVALQAGRESSFTGLIRTASATPSAGSFTRVVAGSGVKALARNATNPGVDIQIPAYGLREELIKRAEATAKASKTLTVFDFDSVAGQTDFPLPMGWKTTSVVSAGNMLREGSTKNFIRLFDGFRETIRFAVAPGAGVWVRINAIKE